MNDPNGNGDPVLDTISNYATAIGMLTIYWAALENSLLHVIERLLGTDDITASCIGTSLDKAAARATLIKRLVRRPNAAPSQEWADCISGMCDQIANQLGPSRNRLIHDEWHVRESEVVRLNRNVKIGKEGPRSPDTILSNSYAPSPVEEINNLTSRVIDTMLHLSMQALQFSTWRKTGKPPEVPQQAIRVSKGLPPNPHQHD